MPATNSAALEDVLNAVKKMFGGIYKEKISNLIMWTIALPLMIGITLFSAALLLGVSACILPAVVLTLGMNKKIRDTFVNTFAKAALFIGLSVMYTALIPLVLTSYFVAIPRAFYSLINPDNRLKELNKKIEKNHKEMSAIVRHFFKKRKKIKDNVSTAVNDEDIGLYVSQKNHGDLFAKKEPSPKIAIIETENTSEITNKK